MDHSEVKHLPKVDHTPAELDDASKLLLKAATLIEEHGLAKWERVSPNSGAMCFYGALASACGTRINGNAWRAIPGAMEAEARMQKATRTEDVSDWNNEDERTKAEVVGKLRAVALGL